MPSAETDQVITVRQKIQTGGGSLFHNDLFRSAIDDFCTPRYDILFFQYTVQKTHPHCAHCIFQDDFQRLCFFPVRIHGGKPLQTFFSLSDLMTDIAQITAVRAVPIVYNERTAAVIPCSHTGIFLGQHIQGIGPVHGRLRRIPGKSPVIIGQEIIHISRHFCTIV